MNIFTAILLLYLGIGIGFALLHFKFSSNIIQSAYLIIFWPIVAYYMFTE